MEILKPSFYHHNRSNTGSNWGSIGEPHRSSGASARWTAEENKMFEDALAVHDSDTPDRWQRVADMIPGKTAEDVIRQYKRLEDDVSSIEAGLVPFPGGYNRNFTSPPQHQQQRHDLGLGSFRVLDWGEGGFDGFRQCFGGNNGGAGGGGGGRRSRPSDHERKKGIPWTEKEHKLFLLGLRKYGKGDWRNISRNFVITRTPTQVASHAQKYFIRQLSGGKDKRRASIHDITTVNLNENQTHSPENQNPHSPDQSMPPHPTNSFSRPHFQWDNNNNNNNHQNNAMEYFMSPYNEMTTNGNFQYVGAQNMGFQMNSAHLYPHG